MVKPPNTMADILVAIDMEIWDEQYQIQQHQA